MIHYAGRPADSALDFSSGNQAQKHLRLVNDLGHPPTNIPRTDWNVLSSSVVCTYLSHDFAIDEIQGVFPFRHLRASEFCFPTYVVFFKLVMQTLSKARLKVCKILIAVPSNCWTGLLTREILGLDGRVLWLRSRGI